MMRATVAVLGAVLLMTPAAEAAPKRTSLKAIGLQAGAASAEGRTLRVRVVAKRTLRLQFAVRRGTRTVASGATTTRKGTRVLRVRLDRPVTGTGLKLRITARPSGAAGRRSVGVGNVALALGGTAGNSQSGSPSTPPPTTPPAPAGPQETPVAPQANRAPSDITLTGTEVTENEPGPQVVGTLSATDEDAGDRHTFTLVGGEGDTDNASFDIIDATLRITAPVDFERQSSYAIRVRGDDGRGGTRAEAFTITVRDVPEGAVAVDDAATVLEDAAATPIDVLANDRAPDGGGAKTISTVTQAAAGAVVITGAGTGLTFRPNANACGADSFTYTLNSGSRATVRVTVTCVDDAPVAAADRFDAVGNVTLATTGIRPARQVARVVTGSLLANDTDPDSPASDLRVEPVAGVATTRGGTITTFADGSFVYEPPAGATGVEDTFTYRVCSSSPCTATTPARSTALLTLPIAGQVWSVRGAAVAGGNGTSRAPFTTLAQAESASGPGDTTVVLQGDGTTTGLATGYALDADEQLLGEAAGLTLDPDGAGAAPSSLLLEAVAGRRPRLTATNEDVLDLAARNRVAALVVDPGGTGGGVAGGAGDAGGTLSDVTVADTADPAGTQPGLELDGTSGTWSISGLDVSTRGATGVRLASAGIVDLDGPAVQATGARALEATGTALATSALGRVVASASPAGGVLLDATTGTIALGDGSAGDLALTTSGATPALRLRGASGVSVPAAGTSTVQATGGPAASIEDVTATAIDLDEATSSGSATEGVLLRRLGTSTFTAAAGSLTGGTDALLLDGGSGTVSYGGTLADGLGGSLRVTGRTGGTATFSGAIADGNDAGGGIAITANTGGTTVLSGGSKAVASGTGDALAFTSSDGHALSITGGGLVLSATSGRGLAAIASGTIALTGEGNAVSTTTGRALDVQLTDIATEGLRLRSVASNGAASGIRLDRTGALGGLTVTGTTTADSGGTVRNSAGPGIELADTRSVSLSRVRVEAGTDDGIRATRVSGLTLADSLVTANGDAAGEHGLDLTDVTGTSAVLRTTVTASKESNARVAQMAGSSVWTIDGSTFSSSSADLGAHGLDLSPGGTASLRMLVSGSTFRANRDSQFLLATAGGTPQVDLTVRGATVTGSPSGLSSAPGFVAAPGDGAQTRLNLETSTITGTSGPAVVLNPLPGSASSSSFDGSLVGNTIGQAGVAGSGSATAEGLLVRLAGDGRSRVSVRDNRVQGTAQLPVSLRAEDGLGGPAADITLTGNTVLPSTGTGADGILVQSGVTTGDNVAMCVEVGSTTSSLHNAFAASGTGGFPDIRFRQRFATTLKLPGYSGSDGSALTSYIRSRNAGAPTTAFTGTLGNSASSCVKPTPATGGQ